VRGAEEGGVLVAGHVGEDEGGGEGADGVVDEELELGGGSGCGLGEKERESGKKKKSKTKRRRRGEAMRVNEGGSEYDDVVRTTERSLVRFQSEKKRVDVTSKLVNALCLTLHRLDGKFADERTTCYGPYLCPRRRRRRRKGWEKGEGFSLRL
jgi:hypothetical protein